MDFFEYFCASCAIGSIFILFLAAIPLWNFIRSPRVRKLGFWKTVRENIVCLLRAPAKVKLSVSFLSVVCLFGMVYAIGITFFDRTQAGSLFEQAEYEQSYEAFIIIEDELRVLGSVDDYKVFCLADVYRSEDTYYLHKLTVPGGKEIKFDGEIVEYDPNEKILIETLDLEGEYISPQVTIKIDVQSVAGEDSQKRLKQTESLMHGSGVIVASKNSNMCHYKDCPYAKKISSANLVKFENPERSLLFGFQYNCSYCLEHWGDL